MRKLILTLGVLVFVLGGCLIWWANRAKQTPEEQVVATLEDIARLASARQVRGVLGHVTEDFKFGTMDKGELQKSLQGAFFQYRSGLKVDISGVSVKVDGERASTNGHYTITTQSDGTAAGQTLTGDFKFKWRLEDGEWKVYSAEGDMPQGF